jgi:hypothetical protein
VLARQLDRRVLASEQVILGLGGFLMTSPDEGFFVFHTDLLASTPLKHFTIAMSPDDTPEIAILFGDQAEVLAYDPRQEFLFLPSAQCPVQRRPAPREFS